MWHAVYTPKELHDHLVSRPNVFVVFVNAYYNEMPFFGSCILPRCLLYEGSTQPHLFCVNKSLQCLLFLELHVCVHCAPVVEWWAKGHETTLTKSSSFRNTKTFVSFDLFCRLFFFLHLKIEFFSRSICCILFYVQFGMDTLNNNRILLIKKSIYPIDA